MAMPILERQKRVQFGSKRSTSKNIRQRRRQIEFSAIFAAPKSAIAEACSKRKPFRYAAPRRKISASRIEAYRSMRCRMPSPILPFSCPSSCRQLMSMERVPFRRSDPSPGSSNSLGTTPKPRSKLGSLERHSAILGSFGADLCNRAVIDFRRRLLATIRPAHFAISMPKARPNSASTTPPRDSAANSSTMPISMDSTSRRFRSIAKSIDKKPACRNTPIHIAAHITTNGSRSVESSPNPHPSPWGIATHLSPSNSPIVRRKRPTKTPPCSSVSDRSKRGSSKFNPTSPLTPNGIGLRFRRLNSACATIINASNRSTNRAMHRSLKPTNGIFYLPQSLNR